MMDLLLDLLAQWGAFVRPHVRDISLALVATSLVVFGDDINRMIRRQISRLHFIWRTLIFVVVCAFGYGAFTLFMTPVVANQLAALNNLWLPLVVMALFIVLGMLAQRRRQA